MPLNQQNADNYSQMKAIIDHLPDGILILDEACHITSVNPATLSIFGYTLNEITGLAFQRLLSPAFQQFSIREYSGKLQLEGSRKDGSVFPFILNTSTIELDGHFFYTCIIHDTSEMKQMQEALQISENRIDAIIRSAVDGIITISERGIIEMVNPSASRLFGYQPEELLGKSVNLLMPEPDKSSHDSYMQNYLKTGIGRIIGIGREVTGLRKDGTTFPFHLSISEVNLLNRRVFTGFIHDITEQKLAEERLRRYANELERSNAELQDFAYVSSHDLQEPLRKIQAFGDRLKSREADALSEQGKDYVNRMLNAASRMQSLINDLLAFSRVTTNAQPFCKVNLNEILEGVLSDLEVAINQSNTRIEADKLPVIEAEPIQMRQLFQNLLANAIKFRKAGTTPLIRITARHLQRKAHLIATPGDELLEISFEDNGIGFDEKYLDKIFNVFQRLEGQKYEGSGIGLAICRKIAIRHGGNITARSQPGKGSTFIVTLATRQPKSN
jgi:two-component system, LuxR family, sensor kinase FixL